MDNTDEIICVYQDCAMCGDRGRKLKKIIIDNKLNIRKVSFASDEGKNLIHEAVINHGIGSMPFFTNGEKYSYNLEDFVEKCGKNEEKHIKNVKKVPKKHAKNVKKAVGDENNR